MPTILITGAASGLGQAFTDHYRQQPSTQIIALDIHPISAPHDNIHPFQLDLTDETSLQTFITRDLGSQPIDLVIHSAGIRGLVPFLEDAHPDNVGACETLEDMDAATLSRTFHINALATFTLLRALLPNLRTAREPKVVIMSSRMGSLALNDRDRNPVAAGGGYAYRASKAALNMLVRSLAVDVPEVVFVLCHPGRVETGLVRCREEGAIGAEEAIEGLVPLFERWGRSESGRFFDRFGKVIDW